MLATLNTVAPCPWLMEQYFHKANQHLKEDKWSEAATLWAYITNHYPHFKLAQFKLAICQIKLQYWEGAKQNLLNLIDLNHPDPNIACNLAIVFWKAKEYKNALIYFKFNLKHFPHHLDTRENLAGFYCQFSRFKKAIIQYHEILNYKPSRGDIRFNLAACLQHMGVYDEAMIQYQHILRTQKEHLDSWYNMACIYYALKDYSAACFYWQKCLTHHPQKNTIRFMLSQIQKRDISASDYQHYVKDLFDKYAKYYNQHLQQTLNYQLPTFLNHYLITQMKHPYFSSILELGCGTGLCGKILSKHTEKLIGVDISQHMLNQAKIHNDYQELHHMDCQNYLMMTSINHELIIAVDVIPYIIDLTSLIKVISTRLKTKGAFIFSTEISQDYPYQMQHNGRMSYHPQFINSLCQELGFFCVDQQKLMIRTEDNIPVIAQVYHWEKT
jgi:predicted TPR repeat methyltransferase